MTRQALAERLPHEVQETEQPEVVDLDEEPEEEQAECPKGCGQRYPARLPGSCSLLPHVLIVCIADVTQLFFYHISFQGR